jgi:hypothetical protein
MPIECMFFLVGRFHFGFLESREFKIGKRLHTECNENNLSVVNQAKTDACS